MTAGAPVVNLTTVEVHMSGVQTSKGGHGGRTILAFLVRARLVKHNNLLLREVGHIIHGDLRARSIGL